MVNDNVIKNGYSVIIPTTPVFSKQGEVTTTSTKLSDRETPRCSQRVFHLRSRDRSIRSSKKRLSSWWHKSNRSLAWATAGAVSPVWRSHAPCWCRLRLSQQTICCDGTWGYRHWPHNNHNISFAMARHHGLTSLCHLQHIWWCNRSLSVGFGAVGGFLAWFVGCFVIGWLLMVASCILRHRLNKRPNPPLISFNGLLAHWCVVRNIAIGYHL